MSAHASTKRRPAPALHAPIDMHRVSYVDHAAASIRPIALSRPQARALDVIGAARVDEADESEQDRQRRVDLLGDVARTVTMGGTAERLDAERPRADRPRAARRAAELRSE